MTTIETNDVREPEALRSRALQIVLRLLVALVGAGIGAALTLAVVQMIHMANPEQELPLLDLAVAYTGTALLGGIVFFFISPWVIRGLSSAFRHLVGRLDRMPVTQLVPSIAGLIVGFVIAALLSQMLHFMGVSVATTALSAIFYVTLGVLGYTVGWRRSKDLLGLIRHAYTFRAKRVRRKKKKRASALPEKLLDASALIDGRLADVRAAGFLEGKLIVPMFVLEELKAIADSADPQKKARGQRGLEMVRRLQTELGDAVSVEDAEVEGADSDVLMLRMARKRGAAIVSCDQTLTKAAAATGVRVLNFNSLAAVLRPALAGGDRVRVTIQKEGREPGQGVAYLEDGTMVVVSGARGLVGQTLEAEVTSVLQTSAGRMVFAKVSGQA